MIKTLKEPLQLEPFLDEFGDLFTKPYVFISPC